MIRDPENSHKLEGRNPRNDEQLIRPTSGSSHKSRSGNHSLSLIFLLALRASPQSIISLFESLFKMRSFLFHLSVSSIAFFVFLSAVGQSRRQEIPRDSRVPREVKFATGYINVSPRPADFKSALLWGIAIADTRVPDYKSAVVEIASTQLSCLMDGKKVIMNDDVGNVRGGLYQRQPWFATDLHEPIPLHYSAIDRTVLLNVGQRADRVWHFWSASPRANLPPGKLEGCTVKVRVKISPGALLQIGMDYWRSSTVPYGSGGNNHEAGASNWYFPSSEWQDAVFTDIGGSQ